jgi:hypothetical protein
MDESPPKKKQKTCTQREFLLYENNVLTVSKEDATRDVFESFTEVMVNKNPTNMNDLRLLCTLLDRNHSVKKLTFWGAGLQNEHAEILGEALAQNKIRVQELYFRPNNIGDAGIAALARGVGKNNHLEVLDLASNDTGCASVVWMAKALPHTKTLRKLEMECEVVERNVIDALLTGLYENDSLEKFVLGHRMISTEHLLNLENAKDEIVKRRKDRMQAAKSTRLLILCAHRFDSQSAFAVLPLEMITHIFKLQCNPKSAREFTLYSYRFATYSDWVLGGVS